MHSAPQATRHALLLLLLMAWLSLPAGAATFTSNFSSGPDPSLHLTLPQQPGSMNVTYSNGQAVFNFIGGPNPITQDNDAYLGLYTSFGLIGNYTVTVDVDESAMVNDFSVSNPAPVLSDGYFEIYHGPQGASALMGFDTSDVGGTVDSSVVDWTDQGAVTGPRFTLEIQRVGNVISEYYDGNLLHSETGLASPTGGVSIGFWGYGLGDSSLAFSNLQVQADGFTPEPGTCGLGVTAVLFGLALYRKRARQSAKAR